MTKASDNVFPRFLISEGGSTSTPASGQVTLYAKANGLLYSKDDAGTETLVSGGAGGSSFTGQPIAVLPVGQVNAGGATDNGADRARAAPIVIPGSMRVRALWVHVSTSAAGSIQWGLFDYSSNETACTKLAGGSAAPGGTGFREIAADSAPVVVAAGAYWLVIKLPTSTVPTIGVSAPVADMGIYKLITTYTWDDTPDMTTGWSAATGFTSCYLEGDIDASGTRW